MAIRTILAVPGLAETSDDFKRALVHVADSLGMNPDDLATVISFESARSFAADKRNPLSGATGLIQFMGATAKSLGTSLAALAGMSAVEQILGPVHDYFARFGKLPTLEDVYLAVFYPAARGKPDDWIVAREGEPVYTQNAGFDHEKKGYVTRGDIVSTIRSVAASAKGARLSVEMDPPTSGDSGEASADPLYATKAVQDAIAVLASHYKGADPPDFGASDVDGAEGPRTIRAIRWAQKLLGVPVTGSADLPLFGALFFEPSPEQVKDVQSALGFSGADVDGVAGPMTSAAVKAAQKAHKLYADGAIDWLTYRAIVGRAPTANAVDVSTYKLRAGSSSGASALALGAGLVLAALGVALLARKLVGA